MVARGRCGWGFRLSLKWWRWRWARIQRAKQFLVSCNLFDLGMRRGLRAVGVTWLRWANHPFGGVLRMGGSKTLLLRWQG